MNIHRALWCKDLMNYLPLLGIAWLLLLGASGLALWPPWRVGVASYIALIGPGLFAALLAIPYFAGEAGTGTERWLLTLPVRPRTVWWNRFVAVLVLTLPAAGFVWWFIGYCRESLFVIGPAFGYSASDWSNLAKWRGDGLLAYLPVLLTAIYAGSSSPSTRWAWVRFVPLIALFPWLLNTTDAGLEVLPGHWLFWAMWGAAGALLAGCGLRAFAVAAPQELRRRRGLAGRLARRAGLAWAFGGALVYAGATHVTPADIVFLTGTVSPQGDQLLARTAVRRWGLAMSRIFWVDLKAKTLRLTPLNPENVAWYPTRPGVLVDHAPGLYRAPPLPRVREYDVATGKLRRVDIPALHARWLRKARYVEDVRIDPITHDVMLQVYLGQENAFQPHLFYLSADGKAVRDLGSKVSFAGWDWWGRGFYINGTPPGQSKKGRFWWGRLESQPRWIMAYSEDRGKGFSYDGSQVSPNGRWLAILEAGRFYLGGYDGRNLRWVGMSPGTIHAWRWSPDSRALFFLVTVPHERRLVRYRLDTHRTEVLASLPPWSPDRSFYLASPAETHPQRLYLAEWLRRSEPVQWTSLHRGERAQYTRWLWIIDAIRGSVQARILLGQGIEEAGRPDQKPWYAPHPGELSVFGWHTDGRLLAARDQTLVAFDPDTRKEEVLVRWGRDVIREG